MRSVVTIEKTMPDELLAETQAKSKTTAVKQAISDYLKRCRMKKVKSTKGKMEFDLTAEELRHVGCRGTDPISAASSERLLD